MFEIVTDSSCNLPEELIEQFGLNVISLAYHVDGKEYVSYIPGQQADMAGFYAMLRDKKLVTTSCINSEDARKVFEAVLKRGHDLLYIGFSSALSGSYPTGHVVLGDLKKEYPDALILDTDTLGASLGEGLLVYHACKMKEAGKTIQEIHDWLEINKYHLCHWFTVDDLFFLKRGGRVSTGAAVFGTLLGIKPVMHMDDEGRLIPVSKVRGRKSSLMALVKRMQELAVDPEKQTVFISHGDCIEDAQFVADKVRETMGVKDILIHYVEPVIGAHSGPGTVALFFLGRHR